MKNYGVWWNIAGAGWITALPEHHGQLELFPCKRYQPGWSVSWIIDEGYEHPLAFSKEEAISLAKEWSALGHGSYVAKPLGSKLPHQALVFPMEALS
jgi:hypothetical protein